MADISPAPNEPLAQARPMILARAVHKHYGAIQAVAGVDLEIGSGELFGLIGHNGAGKSTLFKMMLGLIPASAGEGISQRRRSSAGISQEERRVNRVSWKFTTHRLCRKIL